MKNLIPANIQPNEYRKELRRLFLDYKNHYLTAAKFAKDNGFTENQASELIKIGREIHESRVKVDILSQKKG